MKRQRAPALEIVKRVLTAARPSFTEREDEHGNVERRRVRRILGRGKFERRTLAQTTIDGVEYQYHATKGWRRRRVEARKPGPTVSKAAATAKVVERQARQVPPAAPRPAKHLNSSLAKRAWRRSSESPRAKQRRQSRRFWGAFVRGEARP